MLVVSALKISMQKKKMRNHHIDYKNCKEKKMNKMNEWMDGLEMKNSETK